MSWSFEFVGTNSAVKKAVQEVKAHQEQDRLALERAKAFVVDEMYHHEGSTGVEVRASGHGSYISKIEVYSKHLTLETWSTS